MWNRVIGPKGFDTDSTLPYRERLIVCYLRQNKIEVGQAYVHDGIWFWWDSNCEIQEDYQIVAWTRFPLEVYETLSNMVCRIS